MSSKEDKKPTISQLYQVGDFIDAKDNQGDWRVGYIVDKSDITKTFKVRFDGWAAKYDELYRFGHPKLREFRTFVLGYTGQKQLPALRQGWKFTLTDHQNKLRQLTRYVLQNSNQKVKNAHEFNQWIRGHNYFYTDFLMTVTYPSVQQINKVIEFFKINIRLCINYLKHILQNFETFVSHLQKNNYEHIEDLQVAKTFAFYEIFDMIYTIVGSYPRLSGFFKDNQDLLREALVAGSNKDIKQAYQIKIVEHFFKSSGFELIDQILKLIRSHPKSISYVFLYSFAHLYSGLSSVIQTKMKENVIKQFKLITDKSIEYLGDKQMKDFYQNQVTELINEISNCSKRTSIEKDIQNWTQTIQLEVYFKMITCPFFDKKLRGITSLQEFIQKNVQQHKEDEQKDLIADKTISKWIESKKLFDVLFSNDNPELIKKSTQLIKYLYHRDNQMQKYIELVWRYRQGKHETALKQIYNFLGEIPLYDKNELFTAQLFKRHLSQVDEASWDPEYIKMIKDYTVNAFFTFSGQVKETFGFKIIYQYLQKNQGDETLLGYLIQILQKLQKTQFLEKFIVQCFLCIEKNISANFHVSLLLRILKQKLIELRNLSIDGRNIIQENITFSKNSQNQNIQQKFDLLNEYLKQAKQIIPDDSFIEFWNQMINSKARVYFFKWLYKVRDSGKVLLTNFVNYETKQYLLQNFWTEEYLKTHQIDEHETIFLYELWKYVNQKQDRIRRENLIIQTLDQNLTCVQKLHLAYKISKNPKVTQILAKALAQIYTCTGENLYQLDIDLVHDFIERIFSQAQVYSQNNDIESIKKMIRLIEQLVFRDQQIFDVSQNSKIESIKTFIVRNPQTNEEKPFRINLLQNLYTFKRLIADKFNLALHKFDLILNDEQILTYKSYFKSIGEFDIKGKIIIKPRKVQASKIKSELNHHLQLLFELLGNKEIQERVWNIVSKLPISNQIRQKILHSENPLKTLQNTSFYKELYMFKVALSLEKKWWSLEVDTMIKFFLSRLQSTPASTEIERQYIMVSAKLLQKVIELDEITNPKLFTQTFVSLFQILKRILRQTNEIISLNPLNIKKFIETFFAIGDLLNKYLDKKALKATQPDALSLMLSDPNIENLFRLCLIEYRHELIRKEFPLRLVKLAVVNKEKYSHRLASIVLNELLDSTVQCPSQNLKEYNLFSCFILQTMSPHLQSFFAEKKSYFFYKLCKLIENQQAQQNSDTTNLPLLCYISLIRFVIQEVSESDLQKFFSYIYNECLFKGNQSKCKSKQTRSSIFNFFMKLIKYQKNSGTIYSIFGYLHQNALWRSRKLQDWTIVHSERLKSSTGYTGLRNLGCICYMNSFFQQIFMVQEFRRALLLAEDPSYDPKTVDDNVLHQVKKMFLNLMFSDKKAYNPKSFCFSFKDYEGNPTNVSQQMDIDEFSGILFDRLQNSLKGTKHSNLIKDTFGGVFSNQIICKGCPHFSETEQSFLSLALTVKDKRSIYESLQTMIKGDTLDGDNAYYCERCDKKVSAVKRVCLKSLPNYLIVALKRFEFDYNTMTKLKVNEYCEFPHQLNLEEYSYEYLRKKQNPKTFEAQQLRSKKYYEYKLKGVVIHIGYADSGHYYSLIQQRNGEQRWLQFNDTIVRKFNVENLNDEAFGGQTGGIQSKEKIKNAYLLIYERVQKINSIKDEVMRQGNSFKNMPMYKQTLDTIQKENFEYNIENILFSGEYLKFLLLMIQEAGKNLQNLELQKFIILAFLTAIMRSKTDPGMFEIVQKIYNTFGKQNITLNSWILTQFCDPKIYDEFFRNCPIRQIKRNLVSWTTLMLKQTPDNQLRINFLKTVVSKITIQNQNNIEALTMLHNLIDEEFCFNFLIQHNIIGRMMEIIIRRDPRVFGSVDKLLPETTEGGNALGYEQIIEKTPFELKKIKYDNQSGIVWALIYKIISRFKISQLPNILHPKQVQYLYLTKQKIYKLLQEVKTKFDIDALTNYLCYLSYDNDQFSNALIEMVEKGLKEFQSKRYRQFFELFMKLTSIQDGLADQRVTWVFYVLRSLKQNQKYAMDCTIIELWLCKVVNENERLRNYLMKEKHILEYLSVLPLKKVPSDQLSKKNINFGETSVNKFHGIPFPTSRRGYMKLLKHVEDFYEKLLKGVYEPIHYFESGNHLNYEKLSIGDKIAYFDVKDKVDYEEAVIKDIFLDKICISRKSIPNRTFWIWIEDQKLTANLNVIKDENSHELDSSKTTEMEDEIDFQAVN